MSWGGWLLGVYVALLVWALRKHQTHFEGPWWFHLRAFLPNWKFYHSPGWMPRLMVRHRNSPQEMPEPWQLVYPRHRFRWFHLFHNPDVNLALAWQNLVDHLADDLQNLPDTVRLEDTAIYQLVQRLAAQSLRSMGVPDHHQCQFALHWVHATRPESEVVLTSTWTDLTPTSSGLKAPSS